MTAKTLLVHNAKRVFIMQKNAVKKAGAIIINRELKAIALVWRPREKDWTFPKGHIEEGENETEAMTREVMEETGMLVEIKDILPNMKYLDGNGRSISLKMFLTMFVQNKPENKTGDEKVEWIPLEGVVRKLSYQNLREYFSLVLIILRNTIL